MRSSQQQLGFVGDGGPAREVFLGHESCKSPCGNGNYNMDALYIGGGLTVLSD